jgi:Cu-Zn family superoxide dismutase
MRKAFLLVGLASIAGCSPKADSANSGAGATSAVTAQPNSGDIKADMKDSTGKDLGTLVLSDLPEGIMIMGSLTGLPPGEHAIHLHATGSCTPFAAAQGHWNPTNKEHGKDNPKGPHMGDTPNITVGADGTVSVMVTSPGGTLKGANGLLDADGAAVVIHAKADDYKSQPAGAAGDRIACGVVK